MTCGERYGQNPDPCHRAKGHRGAHSNRWGTTWATGTDWDAGHWVAALLQQPGNRHESDEQGGGGGE